MNQKLPFVRAMFFVVLIGGLCEAAAQKIETGFLNRSITSNKSEYRYVVYVPREFNCQQTYPVILALHGGGDYGSDGLKHIRQWPGERDSSQLGTLSDYSCFSPGQSGRRTRLATWGRTGSPGRT